MIVPTANYLTSRDYRKLWKLAHTAAIVCIVDYEPGKSNCRDIARTAHSPDYSPQLVQVGSRGICHVFAASIEEFIAQCERCNLEWLVPPVTPDWPARSLLERVGSSLAQVEPEQNGFTSEDKAARVAIREVAAWLRPCLALEHAADKRRAATPLEQLSTPALVPVTGEAGDLRQALESLRELAARHIDELDDLRGRSEGVYGLHKNGDEAPWCDVFPGGHYEQISALTELRDLVSEEVEG